MPYPKKATDEQLIEAYERLNNVWLVAKEFNMCGQSVHERLVKIDRIHKVKHRYNDPRIFTDWLILINEYDNYVTLDGGLDLLAAKLGRTKNFVCRKARELGLTNISRDKTPEAGIRQGIRVKKHLKEHGHPRGMLGHKHSDKTKHTISIKSKKMWETNVYLNSEEYKQKISDRMVQTIKDKGMPNEMYSRCKRGNVTIGGKTYFYRSSWEANVASYLQFLKEHGQILDWDYEMVTFWFEKIKRGVRSYKPDFRITALTGEIYFIEVKGWMDDKSKTKLSRMAKYYPEVKIELLDRKRYNELCKQKGLFKEWGKLN